MTDPRSSMPAANSLWESRTSGTLLTLATSVTPYSQQRPPYPLLEYAASNIAYGPFTTDDMLWRPSTTDFLPTRRVAAAAPKLVPYPIVLPLSI